MTKREVWLIVAAVAVVAFFIGRGTVPRPIEGVVVTSDTTTTYSHVKDTTGVPVDREPVRTDTARLAAVPRPVTPRPTKPAENPAPPEEPTPVDTTRSAPADSVDVLIPIERVTVEGENYTAVLEGYKPSIVEMNLRIPTTTINNNRTVTTRKKWSFVVGPQLGVGYGVGGFTPYVGVGVSFGYCF